MAQLKVEDKGSSRHGKKSKIEIGEYKMSNFGKCKFGIHKSGCGHTNEVIDDKLSAIESKGEMDCETDAGTYHASYEYAPSSEPKECKCQLVEKQSHIKAFEGFTGFQIKMAVDCPIHSKQAPTEIEIPKETLYLLQNCVLESGLHKVHPRVFNFIEQDNKLKIGSTTFKRGAK